MPAGGIRLIPSRGRIAVDRFKNMLAAITPGGIDSVNLRSIGTVALANQTDLALMSGLIVGNTAETMLRPVDCSVLTLVPAGFETPVRARPRRSPAAANVQAVPESSFAMEEM
jgi:hypothetical protein